MADLRDSIDDAIVGGATFAEVAADKKLTAQTTPPLAATGVDPLDPASKPDPALSQVVAAGFDAQEGDAPQIVAVGQDGRSEEHTSELQSLMRISYAVFCLKKKTTRTAPT